MRNTKHGFLAALAALVLLAPACADDADLLMDDALDAQSLDDLDLDGWGTDGEADEIDDLTPVPDAGGCSGLGCECVSDSDCMGDLVCAPPGACTEFPDLDPECPVGSQDCPCGRGDRCADGLYCAILGDAPTCVPCSGPDQGPECGFGE